MVFTTLTSNDSVTNAGLAIFGDDVEEKTLSVKGVIEQTAPFFNIENSAGVDKFTVDAAGVTTAASLATADINGGTIDSTVIGNTTPAAGVFSDLTVNNSLNINTGFAINNNIPAFVPLSIMEQVHNLLISLE